MEAESLTCSASESASLIGICRTKFYSMASSGELGPQPVLGGRYDRQEIIDWIRIGRGCPREQWLKIRGAE